MSGGRQTDLSGDEVFIRRFPVHRACRDGDVGALVSLLKELSNQAHLTVEDPSCGWTPIHWAAHYGQLECVMRLVQMGCEVNTATSRYNLTPTHSAAFAGHPHCVVWLTQAGADVNQQDLVGETPIHKAARSGSLDCIQVLLIAGAKLHLKNASGQTAADVAHASGFHDCFCFIADARRHLRQLPGGKRRPASAAYAAGSAKKARRSEEDEEEEEESMHVDCAELSSEDEGRPAAERTAPEDPAPAPQATPRRAASEMCGSLHLGGSPSSCVSHRPAWWGPAGAGDDGGAGDFLHYGHFHGFGDTAEEPGDGWRLARHKMATSNS